MSRDHGKIRSTLYQRSRKYKRLRGQTHSDDAARLLYSYLLTCEHGNAVGCFVLPPLYVTADLGWDDKHFRTAMDRLVEVGLVGYDPEEEVVRIAGYLDQLPATNAKHAIGIVKAVLALPASPERDRVVDEILAHPSTRKHDAAVALLEGYDRSTIGLPDGSGGGGSTENGTDADLSDDEEGNSEKSGGYDRSIGDLPEVYPTETETETGAAAAAAARARGPDHHGQDDRDPTLGETEGHSDQSVQAEPVDPEPPPEPSSSGPDSGPDVAASGAVEVISSGGPPQTGPPPGEALHVPVDGRGAKTEAGQLVELFDRLQHEVYGGQAREFPAGTDATTAKRWLATAREHGVEDPVELFEPVLRARLQSFKHRGKSPPKALSLFTEEIAYAIKQANEPIEVPKRRDGASHAPAKPSLFAIYNDLKAEAADQ